MRVHKIFPIAALALTGIPAGALAAAPSHPTTPASTNANAHATTTAATARGASMKVQFVLRGTLSNYTAANGTTNGTATLTVKHSNFESKSLKGLALVFVVTSNTKVVLHESAAIANGDNAVIKLRAAKNNSTWTGLTAGQIIDQGAPSNT
jgi:hypothetical protein